VPCLFWKVKKQNEIKKRERRKKKEKEEKKKELKRGYLAVTQFFPLLGAGSAVRTLLIFLFLSFFSFLFSFNIVNLFTFVASSIITCCAL
jgi:uncharacterized membrane protein